MDTATITTLSPAQQRRPPSRTNRSRITNGHNLFRPEVADLRSANYRRYRDVVDALVADQNGLDQCSEARLQLIRRFAACVVLAEQMEARLTLDQEISVERHALLCSTMTRLSAKLGIDRRARDVSPTLNDIIRPPK